MTESSSDLTNGKQPVITEEIKRDIGITRHYVRDLMASSAVAGALSYFAVHFLTANEAFAIAASAACGSAAAYITAKRTANACLRACKALSQTPERLAEFDLKLRSPIERGGVLFGMANASAVNTICWLVRMGAEEVKHPEAILRSDVFDLVSLALTTITVPMALTTLSMMLAMHLSGVRYSMKDYIGTVDFDPEQPNPPADITPKRKLLTSENNKT